MEDVRPWYKKKRYIGALAIAGIIGLSSLGNSTPSTVTTQSASVESAVQTGQNNSVSSGNDSSDSQQIDAAANDSVSDPHSESDVNYYTNVDANQVQSPTYYDSAPVGASAQCGDGTFSFSQHRQGTCSHHGGVSEWL